MKILNVDLDNRGYDIYISNAIINDIEKHLKPIVNKRKILIITDKNVAKYYLEIIQKCFKNYDFSYVIIEPGEVSKSLNTLEYIYAKMIKLNCDRQTVVIGFGGGVVGDIAGLLAATYMRGIDFIQIPTSLLAQVDSSVGGKVAVNFNGIKNIVGAFYQPKAVIIDVNLLTTLETKEFYSGLGEVFKYGLIKDFDFFRWLDENLNQIVKLNSEYLIKIIYKSLLIKKEIVEKDERENNIRKILNFGHTIGHGIEALGNLRTYTHGQAITLGMIFESKLANKLGLIDNKYYNYIVKVLSRIRKPVIFTDNQINYILEIIKHDKKAKNGIPTFVLPVGKGKVDVFNNIDEKVIRQVLRGGV
ncbi:3-dehydroquinate synthase [Caldisalinibacter kiritimatiensis]|uniref:3-dehydroquinate synthase n=1 Tax=Caldisalinibacter kiritimatiensis TaxID=1304284 RepID=R1AVX5_9FIRM|nr:3-dehydroquinate synthase [Caldisalinibacter kiritimatiensis]EOD01338.1 3-dehydroquinate synthase [Caldisalinibacter kiritimatiensis]